MGGIIPAAMSDPQRERAVWSAELRAGGEYLVAVARRFFEDRSLQTAGSLTFTTLLALVPLLTVALALSTAFPVFEHAVAALQKFAVENLLPATGSAHAISEQIVAFTRKAGRLTALGLAFLAVTAIMLMLTIDEAMNRIFRVLRPRPLAQRLLTYWSVLTLGPVLIGASLSMSSFLVGQSLGMLPRLGWLADLVLRTLPVAFTCAAFTMLYLVVPYRRIEVRHALAGGLMASLTFELTKRGFALYILHFPTYAMIYGAFAAVPIFLVWVYVSWVVVLAGATITAMLPAYHAAKAERQRPPGADLVDALEVLGALAKAQASGEVPMLTQIAHRVRLLPYRCERVLERGVRLGWTAKTERDAWLLARDAASIRLADVYRAFVLDPEPHARVAAKAYERLAAPLSAHWKHVDADLDLNLKQFAEQSSHSRGA